MNSNSKAAQTTPSDLIAPCMTISASVSPVAACASARRSGYFFESLNLRLSTGRISAPISKRPSGSSSASRRARAPMRWWSPHLGQTFWFFSRSVL